MKMEGNRLLFIFSSGYVSVGCYKATSDSAIQVIEGTDSILNESYSSRSNPTAKCAVAAMRAGYRMFAVQDGGQCAAGATALQTFNKYGISTACKADGEGGPSANQVYLIKGETIKLINFINRFVMSFNSIPLIHIIFALAFIPFLFCPSQYCLSAVTFSGF